MSNVKLALVGGAVVVLLFCPNCAIHRWVDSHASKILSEDMRVLAERGDPEAQYYLGMMYNNGLGVAHDPGKALEWFRRAESGGDPLAAYKLGCYHGGQFNVIPADPEKSLNFKLVAARAGYDLAQLDVANIYYEQQRYAEAMKWLELSARQGCDWALYRLYCIYYEGKAVPRDNLLAYVNFKLAQQVSRGKITRKAQHVLDDLKKEMSAPELDRAEEMVDAWKPEPTALTRRARSGFGPAVELAMAAETNR